MYRSLLVPLDGSPMSEQALPVAQVIARRDGATLHLVHVRTPQNPIFMPDVPVVDTDLRALGHQHATAYIDQHVSKLIAEGFAAVGAVLPNQPSIVGALANYAVENSCDLVVMTTHGRRGFERMWLGSVADALVRSSPAPVLLVRPDTPFAAAPQFRRILLPLDGTEMAERIIEPTLGLAQQPDAKMVLLQVVEPLAQVNYPPLAHLDQIAKQHNAEMAEQARAYLEQVGQKLEGSTYETQVLLSVSPAQAIMYAAEEQEVDLIAMTTHSRRGLERLLLGSVVDKVLRGTPLPILLLHPLG